MGNHRLEKMISDQFGSSIPTGCGMVVCLSKQGKLSAYGDIEKIDARWSNGRILDSRCIGAKVFGSRVFAVYRKESLPEITIQEFDGNPIFSRIKE